MAIFAARFLPGTRLPLYLAAGMLGHKGGRFALWTGLAALLWTPLLVGGVALVGADIVQPLQQWLGAGWLAIVAAAGLFPFSSAVLKIVVNFNPSSQDFLMIKLQSIKLLCPPGANSLRKCR